MKVGPLGCLALLGAGTIGWMIGRVPDVLEAARRDVAAAAGVGQQAVALAEVPGAPPAQARNSPPAATVQQAVIVRPTPRDAGERQHPTPQRIQSVELANSMGGGVHQHDESVEAEPLSRSVQPQGNFPLASPPSPFDVATAAYVELARGHRRAAAKGFDAALTADPGAPNAPAWTRERRALGKRWSADAYVFLRDNGNVGIGPSPLLGGGQSGASLAWTPTPLARRPIYAVTRITAANTGGLQVNGFDTGTAQVAAGLRWQAVPQLSLSAERLFAIGHGGRDAWTLRLAGGVAKRVGPLLADAYAEGGVIGARHGDLFAGGQARVVIPLTLAALRLEPGGGIWSSIQRADGTVGRVDVGPTFGIAADRWHLRATVDYRFQLTGNAAPGSGPAVTVASAF